MWRFRSRPNCTEILYKMSALNLRAREFVYTKYYSMRKRTFVVTKASDRSIIKSKSFKIAFPNSALRYVAIFGLNGHSSNQGACAE